MNYDGNLLSTNNQKIFEFTELHQSLDSEPRPSRAAEMKFRAQIYKLKVQLEEKEKDALNWKYRYLAKIYLLNT